MATGIGSAALSPYSASSVNTNVAFSHQLAALVDQCDIVVVFGPIDPAEHLHRMPLSRRFRSSNRVGACASLMEGLVGPTPDQPFMTPAHHRGSAFHLSGPRMAARHEKRWSLRLARLRNRRTQTPSASADTPTDTHVIRLTQDRRAGLTKDVQRLYSVGRRRSCSTISIQLPPTPPAGSEPVNEICGPRGAPQHFGHRATVPPFSFINASTPPRCASAARATFRAPAGRSHVADPQPASHSTCTNVAVEGCDARPEAEAAHRSILHGAKSGPIDARTSRVRRRQGARKTSGPAQTPCGQGRDRTGDLPLFRRTLVPTELPGPEGTGHVVNRRASP